MVQAGQRCDFNRYINPTLRVKKNLVFRSTEAKISQKNTGLFAILRGGHGKFRKAHKILAFGAPKNTLGTLFASENNVKYVLSVMEEE